MKGLIKCCAVVAVSTVGLGACGGILEGRLLEENFWAGSGFKDNDQAELGLAEMAKGNYVKAEAYFARALKSNPQDVHALIGQGILYQSTGQATKARELYEAILAIRPDNSHQFVVWNNFSTRPVTEIASVNLAMLESGGVLHGMERGAAGQQVVGAGYLAPGIAPQPGVQLLTMGQPTMPVAPGPAPAAVASPMPAMFSEGDTNLVSRFKTMRALLEQGLVTQEEFNTRRQANIGGLLPLTSPPPAAGLDRTVPTTEQISARLRAIGRALELRAITIGQHAAERSMILDALMPSAPVAVANPGAPPQGLMEAADAVRRLELLQTGGYISTDEYARERLAVESAMQPGGMVAAAAPSGAMPLTPAEMGAQAPLSGRQPAVHLASYRTRKAADRGWAQLRRAHRELLGNFQPEVTKVDLGPGKGIFYRLKAGPVNSEATAAGICKKLKRRRQYCEPSFMGAG